MLISLLNTCSLRRGDGGRGVAAGRRHRVDAARCISHRGLGVGGSRHCRRCLGRRCRGRQRPDRNESPAAGEQEAEGDEAEGRHLGCQR